MKFITFFIINTRFSEVKRPGRALGGFLQTPHVHRPFGGQAGTCPSRLRLSSRRILSFPKTKKAMKGINLSLPKVRVP